MFMNRSSLAGSIANDVTQVAVGTVGILAGCDKARKRVECTPILMNAAEVCSTQHVSTGPYLGTGEDSRDAVVVQSTPAFA